MEVLSKDMITRWLLPHLPTRPGGRRSAVDPAEVVGAIFYKLKTGCQWRWLPVQALFTGEPLRWQGGGTTTLTPGASRMPGKTCGSLAYVCIGRPWTYPASNLTAATLRKLVPPLTF